MKTLLETYQDLHDSLNVSVEIDHRQVLKIVVNDLIDKRNSPSNKDIEAFDTVLLYYLGAEDFNKMVIKKSSSNQ